MSNRLDSEILLSYVPKCIHIKELSEQQQDKIASIFKSYISFLAEVSASEKIMQIFEMTFLHIYCITEETYTAEMQEQLNKTVEAFLRIKYNEWPVWRLLSVVELLSALAPREYCYFRIQLLLKQFTTKERTQELYERVLLIAEDLFEQAIHKFQTNITGTYLKSLSSYQSDKEFNSVILKHMTGGLISQAHEIKLKWVFRVIPESTYTPELLYNSLKNIFNSSANVKDGVLAAHFDKTTFKRPMAFFPNLTAGAIIKEFRDILAEQSKMTRNSVQYNAFELDL